MKTITDYIYDIKQSNDLSEIRFKLDDEPLTQLLLVSNNNLSVELLYDSSTEYYYVKPDQVTTITQTKYDNAEEFSLFDAQTGDYVLENEPISLLKPPAKELIATASSMVVNGRSNTINIVFEDGKSFTPGQTYSIYANYLENNNYEESTDVGELEIQKRTTNTTITPSDQSATVGENLTLNIVVKDRNQNPVSRGTFTVYDGSSVIQSNVLVTGDSTSIHLSFSTAGTHNIWCVYHDTMNEYNDSTSNHEDITVNKVNSSLTVPNSLSIYFDETVNISGTLTNNNNEPLTNQTVMLYDGNVLLQTTSTNTNGLYSFTYTPNGWNIDGNNLTVLYNGTNTQESATAIIPVTLMKRDVTLKSLSVEPAVAGETNTFKCELETTNNVPINDGIITFRVTPSQVQLYNNPVSNSKASVQYDIPMSWEGTTKTFSVRYTGSSNYNSTTNIGNIEIPIKYRTTITLTQNNISLGVGESVTITGTLTSNYTPLLNQTVYLVDYDNLTPIGTTTTDSNGEFSFIYQPNNTNANGQNIYVKFNGDSTNGPSTQTIPVTISQRTVITLEDFYDSQNWANNAEAFYDSQNPEQSLVVLSEDSSPLDWYLGASLSDLDHYVLSFTIVSPDAEGYVFGFSDQTNEEDYLIIAEPNGYIKSDSTNVETNTDGQYQPLVNDEGNGIPITMYITPNGTNNALIHINNGLAYSITFNNNIDLSNTYLIFGIGETLMSIQLTDFYIFV